ncbi:hypothetical protein DAPPUDRAFT_117945 [Daphnia pulex]|uniref:Zinc carboxypeptidase A 1 n=1 Tax=Daphnia pulex TaxID=6669 RepID=E9HU79_DAPPU|nr:hypothetical protein DAPPUDRAFT_117945 [Daphnia pulex]|eukprot:EFX64697.1 hypothetical protein DAPPUDRAFT_117945 [Daphnia pulex]
MKIPIAMYCGLLLSIVAAAKIDYNGHVVIRAFPTTTEQLDVLKDWSTQSISFVDFWFLPTKIGKFVDIHVSPEWYSSVVQTLKDMNIFHKIQIADLGEMERQEQQNIALRRALYNGNKAIDLENYQTYEEVMVYLADLANTNALVSTKIGGSSQEGRDIVQTIISSDLSANKPVLFFECNMHAREWITAATCIWIIDQITSGYGSDSEITALVDQYDWKFVPIANPDGYAYTWSNVSVAIILLTLNNDRLWRKNRVFNGGWQLKIWVYEDSESQRFREILEILRDSERFYEISARF